MYKSISELGTPLYTGQSAGSQWVHYREVPLYVTSGSMGSVMNCSVFAAGDYLPSQSVFILQSVGFELMLHGCVQKPVIYNAFH